MGRVATAHDATSVALRSDVDAGLAIVGGGCAGLSLAVELAERGLAHAGLVVIEPRSAFRRDRTWCSWTLQSHRFDDLITNRWERWGLRHQGRWHVHRARDVVYGEIPSDRFYERAITLLDRHPDVDLQLGVRASAVHDEADGVRIETSAGELRTHLAFDGRPANPGGARPELLQHFRGLHVRTKADVFDPTVATLMDFDVPQDDGIHFMYVLPSDPRSALVEATFLSQETLPEERYQAAIERYLEERCGIRKFEIVDGEAGVIPMSSARPTPRITPHVLRIGTGGGLVRPSTGYAFLAIQRFTRLLADGLERGVFEAPVVRDRTLRMMDAVFLHHLRSHPADAPRLFELLFARVAPDRLTRFLGDVPTAADRLAVIRALPPLPFVRTALRSRAAWMRA